MPEQDTVTGLSGSEEADAQKMRKDMLGQERPAQDDRPPQNEVVPGLSDKVYEPPVQDDAPAAEPAQLEPTEPAHQEPQRGVPPAALTEERTKRQEAERRLAEKDASVRQMEERFNTVMQTVQQGQHDRLQQAQNKPAPNPDEDLQGYVQWMRDQYETQRATDQQEMQSIKQNQAYENEVRGVKDRAMADARTFAGQNPDFGPAYEWSRQQDFAALTAQGYAAQDAATILDRQELNFLADHQRAGRNSAEAFYMAAKARGWQAPAPNGNGHPNSGSAPLSVQPQALYNQPPQQQPQPGRPDLTTMQAGMLESRSLDQAAGGGDAVPMSLEAYANMSDADFAKNQDRIRQIMKSQGMR